MKSLQEQAIAAHRKLRGKIGVLSKASLKTPEDLKIYYTPGVGAVSSYLHLYKEETRNLTIKGNAVAVVSDGSRVLGLGDIGPEAALPVMEGKAMIFKEFANIDAFPIVLATKDVKEIVSTIKNIAPGFGAINLEDISAPRCFAIEKQLQETLDIFVMHDDQHATAIVALAGLLNAFKVIQKDLRKSRIAIIGAGAAGSAVIKLLAAYGAKHLIVVDENGILSKKRQGMETYQKELAFLSNAEGEEGDLAHALKGAQAMIGLSAPNIVKPEYIERMVQKPIVFALANPVPEIMPDLAKQAGAFIVATGRSDFENQVNNALVFPGIFRGALDRGVKRVTETIQINAAKKLSGLIATPSAHKIIPSLFDKRVVPAVASAVR